MAMLAIGEAGKSYPCHREVTASHRATKKGLLLVRGVSKWEQYC